MKSRRGPDSALIGPEEMGFAEQAGTISFSCTSSKKRRTCIRACLGGWVYESREPGQAKAHMPQIFGNMPLVVVISDTLANNDISLNNQVVYQTTKSKLNDLYVHFSYTQDDHLQLRTKQVPRIDGPTLPYDTALTLSGLGTTLLVIVL